MLGDSEHPPVNLELPCRNTQLPRYKQQAGVELGLTQAETVSLELSIVQG